MSECLYLCGCFISRTFFFSFYFFVFVYIFIFYLCNLFPSLDSYLPLYLMNHFPLSLSNFSAFISCIFSHTLPPLSLSLSLPDEWEPFCIPTTDTDYSLPKYHSGAGRPRRFRVNVANTLLLEPNAVTKVYYFGRLARLCGPDILCVDAWRRGLIYLAQKKVVRAQLCCFDVFFIYFMLFPPVLPPLDEGNKQCFVNWDSNILVW